MPELPTGTVTFLFTDLEGSTGLWEKHPEAMKGALARHDAVLREAIEAHRGVVFSSGGDGLVAAFASSPDAVAAALAAQLGLAAEPWHDTGPLRARMALHTAEAELAGENYSSLPLNRCARLMGVAHGGQTLMSAATESLVRDALPDDAALRDLGEHRLRDLVRPMRVFQLVHAGLAVEFPPLGSLDAYPGNLPGQRTPLIGRDAEVAKLVKLVVDQRLVTLTGVGGVGKTRLALQVAAESIDQFADGAWLVPLATVTDPELAPAAVVDALGLGERVGQESIDTLRDALRTKSQLLVLDNCEHLVDASAALADALLDACPAVHLIATSREPLGIDGEQVRRTPSLALPDASADLDEQRGAAAIELFSQRARSVRAEFDLDAEQAAAVVDICARLDGIPLAIELAAARVSALTPSDILARLDERFLVLTGGSRTALERHQTLRAAVDWSYSLLTDDERILFDRLSVFRGSFSLEAAEVVAAGDGLEPARVLDGLASLVTKSMIVVDERGVSARYQMLETLRQYARDRLAESGVATSVRSRHAHYFLEFVRGLRDDLLGAREREAFDRLELDLDNVRAGFEWFVETGDAASAVACVIAQAGWWASVQEGLGRYEDALAIASDLPPATQAQAFGITAWMAISAGQHDRASELGEASLRCAAEAGTHPPMASLAALGLAAFWGNDAARAVELIEEAADVAVAAKNQHEHALANSFLCFVLSQQGEPERALALGEEALALAREIGGPSLIGGILMQLGMAYRTVDLDKAQALLDECLELSAHEVDSVHEWLMMGAAQVRAAARDDRGALELFGEVLEHARRMGDRFPVPTTLESVARLLARSGRPEIAAQLLSAADRCRTELGVAGGPADTAARERTATRLRDELGEDAFAVAWQAGQALTLDEASALARAEATEVASN